MGHGGRERYDHSTDMRSDHRIHRIFLLYYPPFGKQVPRAQRIQFQQLSNFKHRRFLNQTPTSMSMGAADFMSILKDYLYGNPNRNPASPLPMKPVDPASIPQKEGIRVTWFGHSALMLEMEGSTVLLDPMFGKSPSPLPVLGNQRYSKDIPINLEELPVIDAVIFSHDHYDHLDYDSVRKLKGKVRHFYVPLGLGSHLQRWGIPKENITEHNWWDSSALDGLQLVCTPARHFSGRSLFDRDSTLWSSWVIIGRESRVYFSGDSGYGPHFREIGEKYGPFDVTFMECGQYDKRWAHIHMMPEETVQAHLDVRGRRLLPIHWAGFTLAFHDWNEPVERVIRAARQKQVDIVTPRIGEPVTLSSSVFDPDTSSVWWRGIDRRVNGSIRESE